MSSAINPSPRQSTGFTLVELLVVIFIISILVAATLTIVPRVRRAANGAATSAQLTAIAGAIQQYYGDFHAYPGPLPNNQLYSGVDSSQQPFVPSPNGPVFLAGVDASTNSQNIFYLNAKSLDSTHVTGAENLVLGLCGGLRLRVSVSSTATYYFEYHPEDLLGQDGITPNVKGPPSLNPNNPKKQTPYYTPRAGELSLPNNGINGGLFTDSANRHALDSYIPEFVDKYGEPLPILYFRTNVGAKAIAGYRSASPTGYGSTAPGGSALTDPSNPNPGYYYTAQYDLSQNMAYTGCVSTGTVVKIGTVGTAIHGLQGLGTNLLTDTIDTTASGVSTPSNAGQNALAYFKDPSINNIANATNTFQGVARQTDGFILISAGPDRQYGTHDDIIYPGPLQP